MGHRTLNIEDRRRAVLIAAAAAAVGMVGWSAVSVSAIGIEWWRFVLAVLVTGFVCWGIGGAVESWLGMDASERCAPLPRVALGFAVAAALLPLLAELKLGAGFIALFIGVLSLLSYLLLYRRRAAERRSMSAHDALDWMMLAIIVRVCTAGSQFVSVGASTTRLTQYWDLTWHLAMVKEGLFRGLPLVENPLLAGAPRSAYHPAFDDFAVVLIKGLGLPADAGLYGVALPLLGVAFVVGLLALTSYATGSRWAHYFTLGVLAGFPAVALVLSRLSALLGAPSLKGFVDLSQIAYFSYNPPAAMAAVAAAVSVALFARGFARRDKRFLVAAGILAGATVSMKANAALALGPALVCAAGFLAWRRRDVWLFVAPAVAALGAAVVCYLPTRGYSAPMAVDLGAFARWARTEGTDPVVAAVGRMTEGLGLLGDGLFLVATILASSIAWRVVPGAFALVRRPRLPSIEHEDAASGANAYLVSFIIWAAIAGFTIVQVDVGRFSTWNIAGHTLANVTWIGVVLAGIGLYRIATYLLSPRPPVWLAALALVALVACTPLAMRGVETMRQAGGAEIQTPLYELLQRVPEYTAADARVAQNFETERDAWVSGIAGRPAVLERAETYRAYYPGEVEWRTRLLSDLYAAATPAAAREAARGLGVRYAIVGPDDPLALLEAGSERVRVGDWALVGFR